MVRNGFNLKKQISHKFDKVIISSYRTFIAKFRAIDWWKIARKL